MTIIYEGNEKWHFRFNSGTEVILETSEIEAIHDAMENMKFHTMYKANDEKEQSWYIDEHNEQSGM